MIGLLQSTVTFFSESCKRINIWTEVGSAKLKRLQKIGVARWWAKHAALEHIFGCFDSPQPELFHLLIAILLRIVESPKFDAKVTFEANSLLDKWRIFDTHLTSFLLLRVYSTGTSSAEYLQPKDLDYLSAWNMVEKAKEVFKKSGLRKHHENNK